jgi:hypothetical protein
VTLNEGQKKKIEDIALGESITRRKDVNAQIAALRKQIVALSEAAKTPLADELQELEGIVAEEKALQRGHDFSAMKIGKMKK